MKKQVIFLISMVLFSIVFVQSNAQNSSPEFKGDDKVNTIRNADNASLVNNYLLQHVTCPELAVLCQKEGTEVIQFTVSETGNLSDFKVINSVCPELDKEVIRVLKSTSGKWTPGINKKGQPVAKTKEVAFMFGDHDRSTIVNYFVAAASRHYKNGSKCLVEKNNPKKALRHLNMGINYMPNDKAMLALRGLCQYELGETASAERDWNRIVALGGVAHGVDFDELAEMKGHKEMTRMLAPKK